MTRRLNPDKELQAYVIGLALGDGNLSNPNGRATRLRISCDAKYPLLINQIKRSLIKLLPDNAVSQALRPRHCIEVSCYSNYWEDLLGWFATGGSKMGQNAHAPLWVFDKKNYIINCLRGLIETDGSIYFDRSYPMVMFVNIVADLAVDVRIMMESLGFRPKLYSLPTVYHVRLSREVKQFLQLVQPLKA